MSPAQALRAFRAASAYDREQLLACLRRKSAGVASVTSDERLADQIAFLRGLTTHATDERGCLLSRVVVSPAGRVWLAADELSHVMKEAG